jgi:hypothetical protein
LLARPPLAGKEDIAMSIGSLGLVGSLATTPLSQKAAEADKTQREATDQARQVQGATQAEAAAGIGLTEEDGEASERDADGRRLWETPPGKTPSDDPPADEGDSPLLSKDPTGEAGGAVDLVG